MYCYKHSVREGPTINFLNVISNQHFNHSIILIRGKICNYNHRITSACLQYTNELDENCRIKNVEVTIDGRFRVAVELTPGANLLKFQYCCISNELSLVFNAHVNPKFQLKVFYIICQNHDGNFQIPNNEQNTIKEACEKIDLAVRLVQCLYAEMLEKHGFKRKTFNFVKCQPFYSNLSLEEARQWNQNELWNFHAKEILARETDLQQQYKYFGVLASTICINGVIKGHAALGIGDVALFGSGTLYAWPLNFESVEMCFRDDKLVDSKQLMDDSNGRHSFGGCFATALGSICHEIGHIFDLGHTIDGIMGCDIDYVNRMFVIEKIPREMPRRIASQCTLNQTNLNITKATNSRITTVKKTNSILVNYHNRRNDDLTFLSENCAILLNWHKWFNQMEEEFDSIIQYNSDEKIITSSFPLVLVEFRSADTGMCMNYYRLDGINEYNFTIPNDIIRTNYNLIVLDKNGNIRRFSDNEFC